MLESGTWQLADIDEKINGTFEYQYALLPKDESILLRSAERTLASAQEPNTGMNVLIS